MVHLPDLHPSLTESLKLSKEIDGYGPHSVEIKEQEVAKKGQMKGIGRRPRTKALPRLPATPTEVTAAAGTPMQRKMKGGERRRQRVRATESE
jgi:hypothetical protein